MKRQICLYLDIERISKLKEEKVNISSVVNEFIVDIGEPASAALLRRIEEQDKKIIELKKKKEEKETGWING